MALQPPRASGTTADRHRASPGGVRLVELLGALAFATDLGMGQPPGHAARTCLFADAIAGHCGLAESERADVVAVSLLRYLGCTSDAAEVARFAGDEIELAAAVAPFVMGPAEREARAAGGGRWGAGAVARAKAAAMTAHCEAAALLAERLGLADGVIAALRHTFERWDGGGHPDGLAGEAIPLPVRIAVVARDVDVWQRMGGWSAARQIIHDRRGEAYDPTVVDVVLAAGEGLASGCADDPWQELLAADTLAVRVPESRLDGLLTVVADFADAKLPYALGLSREVAHIAGDAAQLLGLDSGSAERLARSALVADVGRCGISNRIWDKPGALSADEVERIRLHPYLAERILIRIPLLRPLAGLASSHHERLNGSGYHRGLRASDLGTEERILAAAHSWCAALQDRPHRPARTPTQAAAKLADDVGQGLLDRRAVAAVIEAAGQPPARLPSFWPDGLTDREVEVLRLACRGNSREQVARRLCISAKTVARHLENAYGKIGVSTRAAAALYAVEHGLLADRS